MNKIHIGENQRQMAKTFFFDSDFTHVMNEADMTSASGVRY